MMLTSVAERGRATRSSEQLPIVFADREERRAALRQRRHWPEGYPVGKLSLLKLQERVALSLEQPEP
jgi:hypothetical protein